MRFRITLETLPEVSGNVLPISYQFELTSALFRLITGEATGDTVSYPTWLQANGLSPEDADHMNLYSVSNLYVPKIHVVRDRLEILVPRIQFWASFLPEVDTRRFLEYMLLGRDLSIGDSHTAVSFTISAIDDVSTVDYNETMEYQSLSPVVVRAIRPNGTLEHLSPSSEYFSRFIVDGLVDRWEMWNKRKYEGSREFKFELLQPERRKAIADTTNKAGGQRAVGYMLKFRLTIDPELQRFAYVAGIGDGIGYGFGYLELLAKQR